MNRFTLRAMLVIVTCFVASPCAVCAADEGDGKDAKTRDPVRWTPTAWQSREYESTPAFTPDGSKAIFMRADPAFRRFRLLESNCVAGRWTAPREPSFASQASAHDGDPFITHDGSTLYFISTRHRFDSVGNEDFDIFSSVLDASGRWGTPKRLPEPVNSTGSELLPSSDRSGSLYIGSSRPGGRGGSDVYVATRAESGAWELAPVDEVNTTSNEYEAEVSPDGQRLAVVSDRTGRSRIHLYRRGGGRWIEFFVVRARDEVFQVGPRFSPDGKRLLFAQAEGGDSGEIMLLDIEEGADMRWPPMCGASSSR